ncbi:hypothetical protein CkaCkLH20_04199 [Colletotrichum karsti]|uniref:Uncharacterized protein n=1 Tax=Colletotrichum karsti TaxID=1095194 RepID=A0A9P6LMF6_9PEZI|nr:uncharacterized protein CkaCkLH20_04199 [Colletotrichum karsti]KAF9878161.1 hypothetical protein CkaCkLH20_04199 [Colletotrichum karsti]
MDPKKTYASTKSIADASYEMGVHRQTVPDAEDAFDDRHDLPPPYEAAGGSTASASAAIPTPPSTLMRDSSPRSSTSSVRGEDAGFLPGAGRAEGYRRTSPMSVDGKDYHDDEASDASSIGRVSNHLRKPRTPSLRATAAASQLPSNQLEAHMCNFSGTSQPGDFDLSRESPGVLGIDIISDNCKEVCPGTCPAAVSLANFAALL